VLPSDSHCRFETAISTQARSILQDAGPLLAFLVFGLAGCGGTPRTAPVPPPAGDSTLASHELLATLGLDGTAEEIPRRLPGTLLTAPEDQVARFAEQNRLFVQGISLPPRTDTGPPRTGIDVLRSELADVDRFDLLYSREGSLQAIVPSPVALSAGAGAWFMDLTPYDIELGGLASASDEALERTSRRILERRRIVSDYVQFRGLSQKLRPVDSLSKKPYVLVSLDKRNGDVGLKEFGPSDLLDGEARAFIRAAFVDPDRFSLVYPVFPTVYSPAVSNNQAQARNFGHHVYETLMKMSPVDGDRILDVGTGSGYLSWVAWSAARTIGRTPTMYAIDINPLAVSNAKAMAHLAGFEINAIAHDNVAGPEGLAFPDVTFRLVIWDMPALPRLLRPHLSERGSRAHPRQLMEYWDDGSTALGSLETFAQTLPQLLESKPTATSSRGAMPSAAVLWNIAPADFPEALPHTFEQVGLTPLLLDTYTSGGGAITCVVYAISLPESGLRRRGGKKLSDLARYHDRRH